MLGVSKKTEKKATITLEIPDSSLNPLKEEYGHETINNLLRLYDGNLPQEAPYKIRLNKFYLKRGDVSPRDKHQIVESNEFPIFFGYGEGAEIHSYSISILDGGKNMLGEDANWIDDYEDFYNIARSYNIIDYGMTLNISYSNRSYDGIWFGMNFTRDSNIDKVVGCSFKFFVTQKYKTPIIRTQ